MAAVKVDGRALNEVHGHMKPREICQVAIDRTIRARKYVPKELCDTFGIPKIYRYHDDEEDLSDEEAYY